MKYFNLIIRVKTSSDEVKFLKYRKVNKPQSLFKHIESKGNVITYINYYDYKTKEFLHSERK